MKTIHAAHLASDPEGDSYLYEGIALLTVSEFALEAVTASSISFQL
jgi:hypothetical protein